MAKPLIPRLVTAPGDPGSGVACVLDIHASGSNPETSEALELSISLFAFKRNTGKVLGIIDQYNGYQEPKEPISGEVLRQYGLSTEQLQGETFDSRRSEYLLLRAEMIIAHDTTFKRAIMLKHSQLAAQRPWRCSATRVAWSGHGVNPNDLSSLFAHHRIMLEQPITLEDRTHALLALLGKTDDRGRPYLLQLI
jgi:DNA polymerase III subunit epsilon